MTEMTPQNLADKREIYSVSEINLQLKQTLSTNFPLLWVEGEISNLARPASGHLYFSIKDKNAQIRCVMFRNSNQRVPFDITNGLQIIIRAKISLYEARGDLQLIVDGMEEAGFGALQRQFEALKKKLYSEGLFTEESKKEIPEFPTGIAVITSPSSAAVKDFLQVSQRRYPSCKKYIYSVPVQGEQAADSIRKAIIAANSDPTIDILVLVRGGGSIEDLWAFNDEALARAIAASEKPIVTGIGHEIDYTIADFAADLRAPTPSIAAELTCPDTQGLLSYIYNIQQTLKRLSLEFIQSRFQSTDWLSQRLKRIHPASIVNNQKQTLQSLQARLRRSTQIQSDRNRYQLDTLLQRLSSQSPQNLINTEKTKLSTWTMKLHASIHLQLNHIKHRFQLCTTTMQAVSPLNTLQRGYSISLKENSVITSYKHVSSGDQLTTYLSSGTIVSRVESTSSKKLPDLAPTENKDSN